MSEEAITCRYVFTTKEFNRACRCFYRNSGSGWWLLAFLLFFIAMILYPVFFPGTPPAETTPGRSPQPDVSGFWLNMIPALVFIVLIVLMPLVLVFANMWAFRRLPSYNQDMQYRLDAESIFLKNAVMELKVTWEAVPRAAESKWGFVLYMKGKRSFHWLPKRGLADGGAVDAFRILLRQHVRDTKKLL